MINAIVTGREKGKTFTMQETSMFQQDKEGNWLLCSITPEFKREACDSKMPVWKYIIDHLSKNNTII